LTWETISKKDEQIKSFKQEKSCLILGDLEWTFLLGIKDLEGYVEIILGEQMKVIETQMKVIIFIFFRIPDKIPSHQVGKAQLFQEIFFLNLQKKS